MTRSVILGITGLLLAGSAHAADLPVKAPPLPNVATWTGFYVGANVGGAWGDRNVGYTGNDIPATNRLTAISTFSGNQPVPSHGVALRGATGGLEAGYNQHIGAAWLVGVAADVNYASIKGSGSGSSVLATLGAGGPVLLTQTITAEQKVDWWGTVRARLGFLPADNLLLYATGGLAYGHVERSSTYRFDGPFGTVAGSLGGVSYLCATPGVTCFSGSRADTQIGWTLGAGGEWRWSGRWSAKVEYLYVNLGSASVDASALALFTPGTRASSYNAAFGATDFHIVRVGMNYRF